jgi:hypothetical protein
MKAESLPALAQGNALCRQRSSVLRPLISAGGKTNVGSLVFFLQACPQMWGALHFFCKPAHKCGEPCIFFASLPTNVGSLAFFLQVCPQMWGAWYFFCKPAHICRASGKVFAGIFICGELQLFI